MFLFRSPITDRFRKGTESCCRNVLLCFPSKTITLFFKQRICCVAISGYYRKLSQSNFSLIHFNRQTDIVFVRTVHGNWSAWRPWSPCSQSCSGGTQTRYRSCNNPRPSYGGDPCPGARIETRMCNQDRPCPGKEGAEIILYVFHRSLSRFCFSFYFCQFLSFFLSLSYHSLVFCLNSPFFALLKPDHC